MQSKDPVEVVAHEHADRAWVKANDRVVAVLHASDIAWQFGDALNGVNDLGHARGMFGTHE